MRALPRPVAETVARHLVAAGEMMEAAPEQAHAHALAARRLAPRLAVVREAVGLTAYRAGQWQSALAELRTYHRMSGQQTHLAVLADCERALGRPQRALDLYRTGRSADLSPEAAAELLIVAAGAQVDLGQHEAAAQLLQVPELTATPPAAWTARLRYAYADILLAAGRREEAREWFSLAAEVDEPGETDAAERLLELDGVELAEAEPDEAEADADQPAGAEQHAEDTEQEAEAEAIAEPAAGGPQAEPAAGEPVVTEPAAPEDAEPVVVGEPAPSTPRLVDAYDLVILDLDGVVLLGQEPLPAAVAAIASLRKDGPRLLFATNNASRGRVELAELLTDAGIPATAEEVVTAAMVAADALAARLDPGAAVLVVGTEALADELRRVGLRPVRTAGADPRTGADRPVAVVQGYGPQVDWSALAEAAVAIRAGAQWVLTNADATLPSPRGPLPGNGALSAVLRTALDREPDLVVGKPAAEFFTRPVRQAGANAALVVGDRLDTDIAGANRAGLDSLLVFSGVTAPGQLRAVDGQQQPTYLGDDLGALLRPAVRYGQAGDGHGSA